MEGGGGGDGGGWEIGRGLIRGTAFGHQDGRLFEIGVLLVVLNLYHFQLPIFSKFIRKKTHCSTFIPSLLVVWRGGGGEGGRRRMGDREKSYSRHGVWPSRWALIRDWWFIRINTLSGN